MVGAIIGGFTILGAFLTVGAWVNGRSIKKYVGDLIKEESRLTREMIAKMDERFAKMDERHTELLGKILEKVS